MSALGPIGCGTMLTDASVARIVVATECDSDAATGDEPPDVVILDWTGGISNIYADEYFEGVDLTAFDTTDGGTLADDGETFKELVREEITRIFCDWPEVSVLLRTSEDDEIPADTIVHITQALPPNGGTDIGEAEYDPCNRQSNNEALIFAERLRQLAGTSTFDGWVAIFANVCAHEIGHTLGYGHVPREGRPDPARWGFVELMLDRHTMAEMRHGQRFLADQTNCPEHLTSNRRLEEPVITCGAQVRLDAR